MATGDCCSSRGGRSDLAPLWHRPRPETRFWKFLAVPQRTNALKTNRLWLVEAPRFGTRTARPSRGEYGLVAKGWQFCEPVAPDCQRNRSSSAFPIGYISYGAALSGRYPEGFEAGQGLERVSGEGCFSASFRTICGLALAPGCGHTRQWSEVPKELACGSSRIHRFNAS